MGTYALVNPQGLVVNIITWNGTTTHQTPGSTKVNVLEVPGIEIGDTYINGVLTKGAPPVLPPEDQDLIDDAAAVQATLPTFENGAATLPQVRAATHVLLRKFYRGSVLG